jgi:pimeloyl-ACP methyl ester carboxylesterase
MDPFRERKAGRTQRPFELRPEDAMMEAFELRLHGHEVAVRTAGSHEAPVLLLLHGLAGSADTWHRVAPLLAHRFRVVAPDLLGHGGSAKPRGEYSLGAHANLLRDLLVALGHERATLVGQSFGGGVAMQFAYQFPTRCERLVLVASGGLGLEVSPLLRALSVAGADLLFPFVCSPALRDAGSRVGAWLGRLGLRASPVVAETWRSYSSLADVDAQRAFFRTLRAVIDSEGQSVSAADRLYLAAGVPTLIVWGAADPIIPVRHAHDAHRSIPGSRLEIYEGVGHYPHCEEPERFAATLSDFVATNPPATLTESDGCALLREARHAGETAAADGRTASRRNS